MAKDATLTAESTTDRQKHAFGDLREYMAFMEDQDQLKKVEGADPELEIGALTAVVAAHKNSSVLLFHDMKGIDPKYRIMTNVLINRKSERAIYGVPPAMADTDTTRWWMDALRGFKPVPPVVVQDAPVKAHVREGKDVDLTVLPWVRWHEKDGGPYLCCTSTVVREQETGFINVGSYRFRTVDRNTIVGHLASGHHGDIIRKKYWSQGKGCPVAISLGQEPSILVGASDAISWGDSEYDFSGWLRGAPVEVTPGVYTDLPIPATAEIVLEGDLLPPEAGSVIEGPFGEMAGYYGDATATPLVRIHSILERDDPIVLGMPPFPGLIPRRLLGSRGVTVWLELERAGIPGIKGIRYSGGVLVIAVEQSFPGHAMRAVLTALGGTGGYHTRFAVIVDEDVNPNDPGQVMSAIGTRCDPATALDVTRRMWSSRVDPRLEPEKIAKGDFTSSVAIVDATRPFHWRDEFPERVRLSPELRRQTEEKWRDLLEDE